MNTVREQISVLFLNIMFGSLEVNSILLARLK
jgi:hypothetical protein